MSVAAPVKYRPATEADIPSVARLVVPDPASPLTEAGFRARLASGEYRPEWMWVADSSSASRPGEGGIEAAAVWWGDTGPNGLDAILARPDLDRDRRAAVAGELLTAAHLAYNRTRTLPAYYLHLPVDWRSRPDVVAALTWRWQAAVASGLTDELERLRFEWTAGTPLPEADSGLTFRREPDDRVFADLFRRALGGTLDATSRRMADVVGDYSQAMSDVDFYRDRLPGDRRWWFTAHAPDGEPVGFGVPNRNSQVAVVGYLGVLPEYRGHGYIHDILGEVTRILSVEAGERLIHADTDVANRPMAAAFRRAGYRNTARRVVLSAPLILA